MAMKGRALPYTERRHPANSRHRANRFNTARVDAKNRRKNSFLWPQAQPIPPLVPSARQSSSLINHPMESRRMAPAKMT